MEKYDYMESLKEDIKDYIKENMEYLEGKDADELYDDFFVEDAITGNASGSYTFSTWKAEENICHNYVKIYNIKDKNSHIERMLEDLRETIFDYSITWKMSVYEIVKAQLETGIYKIPVFDDGFAMLLGEVIEDYEYYLKKGNKEIL